MSIAIFLFAFMAGAMFVNFTLVRPAQRNVKKALELLESAPAKEKQS